MQAAADVDDLPTYEPAPDTTHQDGLVTIQGRYATLTGIRAGAAGEISYSEGEKFDSICFGRRPDCSSLHNTVLLVPGLLSPAECEKLILEVEKTHASDAKKNSAIQEKQRRRMHIPALSDATVEKYDELLRERLLPSFRASFRRSRITSGGARRACARTQRAMVAGCRAWRSAQMEQR
jgi:hypothetical protein